jgi:hypothetical protein
LKGITNIFRPSLRVLALIGCLVGLSCREARQQANVSEPTAQPSPISISIAVPAENGAERSVIYRDASTHFHIIVSNVSAAQQRIWSDICSWGWNGLSFEITDDNAKTWVAKKMHSAWTGNIPTFWTLDPGDCLALEVPFEDTNWWEGLPSPHNGSQTVTMRAVLSFKPDEWSRLYSVWTGRVVSEPERITFQRRDPEGK